MMKMVHIICKFCVQSKKKILHNSDNNKTVVPACHTLVSNQHLSVFCRVLQISLSVVGKFGK